MTSGPLRPVRPDPYMSDNPVQNEATQASLPRTPGKTAKNTPALIRAEKKTAELLQKTDQFFTPGALARAGKQLESGRFSDPNAAPQEPAANSNELDAEIAEIMKNNGF